MLMPASQFFRTMTDRRCACCGTVLEELADCYNTVCERCDGSAYYPLSPVSSRSSLSTPHPRRKLSRDLP